MNLSLKIARRYLFARKSTNAINIISGVAVLGIAIGTAALILILSVFNGFEDLLSSLFGAFNPPVKVTPAKGKTFEPDSSDIAQLNLIDGLAYVSGTLEEIAFFDYEKVQDFGLIKGVDSLFNRVVDIDSSIIEGKYQLKDGERYLAVLGSGVRTKLGINMRDQFAALRVYMPRRKQSIGLSKPYRSRLIQPAGTFFIQQEFDQQYVLTDIAFARELMGYDRELSALEISLRPEANLELVKSRIREVMGPEYLVRDRYEQDEAFLKLMRLEKWMGFAILAFTMILVAFNMIGSLWMIVLDKRQDIAILKSMGATDQLVRNVFLFEGFLLTGLGMLIGFGLALAFFAAQKYLGLISIPAGFIINAYPISIRLPDFFLVAFTVALIGTLASLPAALRAMRVDAVVRDE
jgi:lipoprotein-releasing system permease protein